MPTACFQHVVYATQRCDACSASWVSRATCSTRSAKPPRVVTDIVVCSAHLSKPERCQDSCGSGWLKSASRYARSPYALDKASRRSLRIFTIGFGERFGGIKTIFLPKIVGDLRTTEIRRWEVQSGPSTLFTSVKGTTMVRNRFDTRRASPSRYTLFNLPSIQKVNPKPVNQNKNAHTARSSINPRRKTSTSREPIPKSQIPGNKYFQRNVVAAESLMYAS